MYREPACCASLLRIVTQEEVPIVFGGEGGAILLDSPEFLNFDFPTLDFFVSVAVERGRLSFTRIYRYIDI